MGVPYSTAPDSTADKMSAANAFDLETAIYKARGAASALTVVLNALTENEPDNWKKLGLKRWCGLHMLLLSEFEREALEHAADAVGEAIGVIDAAFLSAPRCRA